MSEIVERQAAEIERLRAALKEIQAKAVQFKPPRYSWFYDRAEQALKHE